MVSISIYIFEFSFYRQQFLLFFWWAGISWVVDRTKRTVLYSCNTPLKMRVKNDILDSSSNVFRNPEALPLLLSNEMRSISSEIKNICCKVLEILWISWNDSFRLYHIMIIDLTFCRDHSHWYQQELFSIWLNIWTS